MSSTFIQRPEHTGKYKNRSPLSPIIVCCSTVSKHPRRNQQNFPLLICKLTQKPVHGNQAVPFPACGYPQSLTHSLTRTPSVPLRHRSEHGIVPTDTRAILLVRCLCVAHLVELGRGRQHAASEPHRIPLHMVRDHRHVDRLRLQRTNNKMSVAVSYDRMTPPTHLNSPLAQVLADLQTTIHGPLNVAL